MNKRALGTGYEQRSASYLEKMGYSIICSNYRCHAGEIDLIAKDGIYLVFIEVKYRSDADKGTASEAVNRKKQQRISKAALSYIHENHISESQPCRFDVVAVDNDRISLIKDAFWS